MSTDKRTHAIKATAPEYIKEELHQRARQAGCSDSDLLLDIVCLSFYSVTYGEHESKYRRGALGLQANPLSQNAANTGPHVDPTNHSVVANSQGRFGSGA